LPGLGPCSTVINVRSEAIGFILNDPGNYSLPTTEVKPVADADAAPGRRIFPCHSVSRIIIAQYRRAEPQSNNFIGNSDQTLPSLPRLTMAGHCHATRVR